MITPEQVKESLPRVRVLDGKGDLFWGLVAGRSLTFALVYDERDASRSWEFSWSAIARCLNEKRPLRAG